MIEVAPAELELVPLEGKARPLSAWLTTFHLVTAVLDPYTAESAWLLPTVGRIFRVYAEADCRVAITVTCSAEEAAQFLGPYAKEFLTFVDPDRATVKALGFEVLPGLVHIRQDLTVAGFAEGWNPEEWRAVTSYLSTAMSWSEPLVPAPSDPVPYAGTPALD
ncbi:MAG: hypothetical protein JF603_06920 [Acidobacteria bacterium]|nr:hypothetical protein [Acidobacteriota bacterium]